MLMASPHWTTLMQQDIRCSANQIFQRFASEMHTFIYKANCCVYAVAINCSRQIFLHATANPCCNILKVMKFHIVRWVTILLCENTFSEGFEISEKYLILAESEVMRAGKYLLDTMEKPGPVWIIFFIVQYNTRRA